MAKVYNEGEEETRSAAVAKSEPPLELGQFTVDASHHGFVLLLSTTSDRDLEELGNVTIRWA